MTEIRVDGARHLGYRLVPLGLVADRKQASEGEEMPLCSRILDQECVACWGSGRDHSTRPVMVSGRIPVAAVVVLLSRSDYCSRLALCDRPISGVDYSCWGLGEWYKSVVLVVDGTEGFVGTLVVAAPVKLVLNLTFRGSSDQKDSVRGNCKHFSKVFVSCY